MNTRSATAERSILVLVGLILTAVLAASGNAQDVYVDAESGDNWNNGTAASPWKTVQYALTGAHAPLPQGTTIHLMGTQTVNYSTNSNDAFPWVLYNNISLKGEPNPPTYPNVIVDGQNASSVVLVEYDPADAVTSSRIEGIEFVNATTAISAAPSGRAFGPEIENCTFTSVKYCISISGSGASTMYPTVNDNVADNNGNTFLAYHTQGCMAYGVFTNNTVSGYAFGISVDGAPAGGGLTITDNDIIANDRAVTLSSYNARVRIENNRLTGSKLNPYVHCAVYVVGCNPWHPESVISNNICKSFTGIINISTTDNIVIENNSCTYGYAGILVTSSDNVIVRGNVVDDCAYGSPSPVASLRVEKCDNVLVEGNTVKNGHSGILLNGNSVGNIVRGNTVHDCANIGIRIESSASDTLVESNTVMANGNAGIKVTTQGVKVVRNLVYNNTPGDGIQDTACTGNLYSSNIIHHNGGYGVNLLGGTGVTPPDFVHNTCADNGLHGIQSNLGAGHPIFIVNSIFWDNNTGLGDIAGVSGMYDFCCVGIGGSPGYGNIKDDPKFENQLLGDYHLMSDSPCIKTGFDNRKKWAADIDGNPRILDGDWKGNVRTDMGADEYGEAKLNVTGTFIPGSFLTIEIDAPGGPNAPFTLMFGSSHAEFPLAEVGKEYGQWGTYLLDPKKIVYGGPVLTGQLNPQGYYLDSTKVKLPLLSQLIGLKVALQALIGNAAYGAGQGTPAETFTITQ